MELEGEQGLILMELGEAELGEAELGKAELGEVELGEVEPEGGQEPEEHEEQGLEVVPQPSHSPGETLVLKVRGWIPAHAAAFEVL